MVVLHEAAFIEGIEVKHSFPNRRVILAGLTVRLERDKRLCVMVCYCLQVVARQIGFIRAYLAHSEVAPGCLNQSRELRTVVSAFGSFYAGHNVGFCSAHQMHLDPFVPL